MKLPFVLRKKYDAIQNKNMKLMKDKDKQLKLASEYSDTILNKNCELNTKLIAAETKNEELETKIKELEFCLNDCKYENKKMIEKLKLTNIVKKQLSDLTELKDGKSGKRIIEGKSVLVKDKVPGDKVYNLARLLG
ncbi:hypothetical protein EAI30_13585 [Romboutsia ilealis]|uniref:Uncharacterized protein n=1 Tax=Romboutsia faecis TaxID=2764597 RepID=A0ABR7JT63_9FIRM|nr:hypothetical protein [Romboutsia faecis]MBC5997957.1 hypothetical protein [Romboutsia faecis]MRN25650.1 hypothetical protein [Romboutsia ilealis]